jgi:hypothetical protein
MAVCTLVSGCSQLWCTREACEVVAVICQDSASAMFEFDPKRGVSAHEHCPVRVGQVTTTEIS